MARRTAGLLLAFISVTTAACAGERAPLDYQTRQWSTYEGKPSSDVVTVYFSAGYTNDKDNACYEPRRLTATETDTAVTVRLEVSGSQGPFDIGSGCGDIAITASERITLRQPLGKRLVLDAARPNIRPSATRG